MRPADENLLARIKEGGKPGPGDNAGLDRLIDAGLVDRKSWKVTKKGAQHVAVRKKKK